MWTCVSDCNQQSTVDSFTCLTPSLPKLNVVSQHSASHLSHNLNVASNTLPSVASQQVLSEGPRAQDVRQQATRQRAAVAAGPAHGVGVRNPVSVCRKPERRMLRDRRWVSDFAVPTATEAGGGGAGISAATRLPIMRGSSGTRRRPPDSRKRRRVELDAG